MKSYILNQGFKKIEECNKIINAKKFAKRLLNFQCYSDEAMNQGDIEMFIVVE